MIYIPVVTNIVRDLNAGPGPSYDVVLAVLTIIIEQFDLADNTIDPQQWAEFHGKAQGLILALKLLGAGSNNIVDALDALDALDAMEALRKERNNE